VIPVIVVLFLLLLVLSAAAPSIGVDTSDTRAERTRPEKDWYPALPFT